MADYTITLDALQERAMAALTQRHNLSFGTSLTPQQYFALKATEQLETLVRSYKEVVADSWRKDFDAAPPERQQLFAAGQITLAQLRGEVPIGPQVKRRGKTR
jgi:hypothetical protein